MNCHPWLSPLLPPVLPGPGGAGAPCPRVSLDHALPPLQVEQFMEGVEETPVQAGARRVRISCRDPYNPSAWSPWSAWMSLEAP